MNADIKNNIKQCVTCLEYQQIQPQEKTIMYEVHVGHGRLLVLISLLLKIKLLCNVYSYSKFPIVKKAGSLAVDDPGRNNQDDIYRK